MRIFTNLLEAHKEIERDLHEMGILVHPETYQDKNIKDNPDFETKELFGYGYMITNTHSTMVEKQFEELGGNIFYLQHELIDRLSKGWLNPGSAYLKRPEVWETFLQKGKFSYTYNERIRTQLPVVLEQLRQNPNTRQAVITIYDHHHDLAHMGGQARIPCSMHYQYMRRVREDKTKLDSIYTMRSCDFYTHFIYDSALGMLMQDYIAHEVGIESGRFVHFIGSLHAYRKDWEKRRVF